MEKGFLRHAISEILFATYIAEILDMILETAKKEYVIVITETKSIQNKTK